MVSGGGWLTSSSWSPRITLDALEFESFWTVLGKLWFLLTAMVNRAISSAGCIVNQSE